MQLYIIKDYKKTFENLKGSQLTDKLIKECLSKKGIENCEILRTEKGKPYIEVDGSRNNIFCSVSHSGNLFSCVFHNAEIGLDVQELRNVKYDKISSRYFTENEKKFVNSGGEDAFFTIWTRKEAYAKYTGDGLEEIIRGSTVIDRKDVEFFDIMIEKNIYCSCCLKKVV